MTDKNIKLDAGLREKIKDEISSYLLQAAYKDPKQKVVASMKPHWSLEIALVKKGDTYSLKYVSEKEKNRPEYRVEVNSLRDVYSIIPNKSCSGGCFPLLIYSHVEPEITLYRKKEDRLTKIGSTKTNAPFINSKSWIDRIKKIMGINKGE